MIINVGDFHAGFNLFTGERTFDSYYEEGGADFDTMIQMKMGQILGHGDADGGYGAKLGNAPNLVIEMFLKFNLLIIKTNRILI
jgi:hypothetical protein